MITIVIYMLCIVYLLYYVNKHQEKKNQSFSTVVSLPISSLFLGLRARFLRAVAAAQTTRSASIDSSSTMIGRPFSFRTAALISADGYKR